jgi:hypothetical protein
MLSARGARVIQDTVQVRSAAFGLIFPANPVLTPQENIRFYQAAVASGLDLPEVTQNQGGVVLTNRGNATPQRVLQVRADHIAQQVAGQPTVTVGQQFRFVVSEDFPTRSRTLFTKDADMAWECFRTIWPESRTGKPVMAEVTIRLIAASEGADATRYMRERVMGLPAAAVEQLGRQAFGLGLRLMFPVQVDRDRRLPVVGAGMTIGVETLREDPSRLYFEATSQWPMVQMPQEIVSAGGPPQLNPTLRKPSEYLDEVYDYMTGPVVSFLQASAADRPSA